MAEREGGGSKILRGLVIAVVIVAAIVLLAVFWRQVLDALQSAGTYVSDRFPTETGQAAAVVIYVILSIVLGVLFSKAGHFTAYGVVMGLGPLLWFLFWEGFPLLGLHATWTDSMGLSHLAPSRVILFAVVADIIITLVFVPLELREKFQHRRHELANDDEAAGCQRSLTDLVVVATGSGSNHNKVGANVSAVGG
jgi:hypothetical protein